MYTETKPGSLTTIVNVESTNVTKQKKNPNYPYREFSSRIRLIIMFSGSPCNC